MWFFMKNLLGISVKKVEKTKTIFMNDEEE